jgi:TolB protein
MRPKRLFSGGWSRGRRWAILANILCLSSHRALWIWLLCLLAASCGSVSSPAPTATALNTVLPTPKEAILRMLTPAATSTRVLAQPGLIAFVAFSAGQNEIYTIRADGTNLTKVTNQLAGSEGPDWSFDGKQIAFWSTRDGNVGLYVMNFDGSSVRRLVYGSVMTDRPSWSPDGRHIAFVGIDNGFGIWVVDIDTLVITALTKDSALDGTPAWSPDGKRIIFSSIRSGRPQLYSMGTDGRNVNQLTEEAVGAAYPAWSPDGKKIAYQCLSNRGTVTCVINSDGSQRVQLIDPDKYLDGDQPSWSPDGSSIVFRSMRAVTERSGPDDLYIMNSDGSNVTRLTDRSVTGFRSVDQPAWQPQSP